MTNPFARASVNKSALPFHFNGRATTVPPSTSTLHG
jgi:hypothetical protein